MESNVASCLVCGEEKKLAVWVDPVIKSGVFQGVCFQCRQDAEQINQTDLLHKIGWWIFDNIPLGKLAPRFFGWLIGSKPVRVTKYSKRGIRRQ